MPHQRATRNRPLFTWMRRDRIDTSLTILVLLLLLVCLAMLFGGSNQIGRLGTIPLRLFAIGAICTVILGTFKVGVRPLASPILVLAGGLVWMALQLVPLPPAVWTEFPARDYYAVVAELAGLSDVWRPLSISPERTINSLLAVLPPLAALLLVARVSVRDNGFLVAIVLSAAALTSLLGLLQAGTGSTILALYDSRSAGDATGFFANRNHQAVFVASAIPLAGAWAASASSSERFQRLVIAVLLATLMLSAALLTRSRMGVVSVILASGLFALFLGWFSWKALLGGVLAIGLLAFGFGFAERIAERQLADDLRFQFAPITLEMAREHIVFGSGFGTFDPAFRMEEPEEQLSFQYFNHAHNDIVELVIEGGIPAVLLLLVALAWLVLRTSDVWRRNIPKSSKRRGADIRYAKAASFALALAFFGSFVDYPFRAPLFAVLMALFAGLLATPKQMSFQRSNA